MTLNPKQRRFVEEYLVDLNATQAAIRAGYSRKTARAQGSRLLTNAVIESAIQAGREALSRSTNITAERVLQELARIGFADIRNIFDVNGALLSPSDMPDDIARAVSSVEVVTVSKGEGMVEHVAKVRLADKRAALVDLGKHLGLFVAKHEVSGLGGGPVVFRRIVVDPKEGQE